MQIKDIALELRKSALGKETAKDVRLIAADKLEAVEAEKAALLERLREPSEAMVSAGYLSIYDTSGDTKPEEVWQAMLAQFEKENSDE